MANGRAQGQDLQVDLDDDDFDFGGFEAADPVPEVQGMQAAAQASPWAAFASGNAQERPDLLCAQNRFPPYLDPSDISGASAGARNLNVDDIDVPPHPPVAADLLGDAQFAEAMLADGPDAADSILNPNGRLPDLGLGINDNHLFLNGPTNQLPIAAAAPDPQLQLRNDDIVVNAVVPQPDLPEGGVDPSENGRQNVPRAEQNEPNVDVGDQQPEQENLGDQEREGLTQQVNSLTERNRALEEELERSRSELETQRSRLQEIEARHSETLEEVRHAGHDALSVVVEQYKEQMKTVVLEQQEASQRHMLETMREQTTSFQEMLQTQEQKHEEVRTQDKEELKRSIEKAVEDTRLEEQDKFQVFLQEEQEKWKKDFEKSVQEERASCQAEVQRVLNEEQATARDRLDEARAEYSNLLEAERKKQEEALATVRQEEAERAREHLAVIVSEERDRGRESVREALEAARADTRSYIDEQRQSDSRVRQRHLASLDLFLESCRQQISFLMESEQNSGAVLKLPRRREDQDKDDDNDGADS